MAKKNDNAFSADLIEAMARANLTIAETADALDLSPSILCKWRAGSREPHWLMKCAVLAEINRNRRNTK